jgi:hypothetical protein
LRSYQHFLETFNAKAQNGTFLKILHKLSMIVLQTSIIISLKPAKLPPFIYATTPNYLRYNPQLSTLQLPNYLPYNPQISTLYNSQLSTLQLLNYLRYNPQISTLQLAIIYTTTPNYVRYNPQISTLQLPIIYATTPNYVRYSPNYLCYNPQLSTLQLPIIYATTPNCLRSGTFTLGYAKARRSYATPHKN